MLASTYPGSAGSLLRSAIKSIEGIVNRLEYAGRVGGDHWPLAGKLHGLDCLRLDLKAAAAGDGLIGADVYELVAQAHDQLLPAVEAHDQGDLDPWRSGREAVQATLDQLRELFDPQGGGELVVRSAAVAATLPPLRKPASIPVVHDRDGRRKGKEGEKPPRRRRPGSGRPNGRPSKDADDLLEKVIRQITDEARREGLNVERELHARVYSQTAEALCETIRDRLRKEIAPSTLRSSSKLWARWAMFRKAKGKPAAGTGADAPVEPGAIHVGGVKRTADERRQDAEIARWAAEAGVSLDDD